MKDNNVFKTDDFIFVSFWLLKGNKILGLTKPSKKVIFHLPLEAEEMFQKWQLIPDEIMELLQRYESQRTKVLRTIKSYQPTNEMKQNGGYNAQENITE